MYQDDYGLALTTESAAAAASLGRAIGSFNHWRLDLMEHLDAALGHDPGFAMAHAIKGLALAQGRNIRFQPAVDAALAAATAGISTGIGTGAGAVSPRERLYIRALDQAVQGQLNRAVDSFRDILDDHPTDLTAHRMVQQELFWMGEAGRMQEIAEAAAPAWSAATPDRGMFLSVRSFGNEEALAYQAAERYGREAVEIDPGDVWGTHAVAHVLVMQGRIDDGIAWLEPLTGNWAGKNQIVHHLWWHLCLFLLEKGEHDRILALYDAQVRNPDSALVQAMPDAYIDIQNAAALLLRLELRGVDVGDRWTGLAEVAEGRIDNPQSPFTNAHAAMILAANGRHDRADDLVRSMTSFAAQHEGPLASATSQAALPAAKAAIAHAEGDHEGVVAALMPARRHLYRMGGSHAQRDIFFQILVDSCRRLGRGAEVAQLLDEIGAIGFANVAERSLYGDAAAN